MLRRWLLPVVALAAAAAPAAAQSSVFGIRGLGVPGRAVTGRNAGLGGALSALEPGSAVNPGALGLWRGLAGWATGAPSRATFDRPGGDVSIESVRFPLFGFATVIRNRLALGVTISDYLDRSWSVAVTDTAVVRTDTVVFDDVQRSLGGVSDIRLGMSYRASPRVAFGLGMHSFAGSTRLSVQRNYQSTLYDDYFDVSTTDYRGYGVSAGVVGALGSRVQLGASVRLNGDLRAKNASGLEASVAMPNEATLGAAVTVVPGVTAQSTVQYQGWARGAGDLAAVNLPAPRNTWSVAAGVEVDRTRLLLFRSPLRLGYRYRQLPTPIGGEHLDERAFSAGIGFNLAQGRTVIDLAVEAGSRSTVAQRESFRTVFLGVTVRP